MNWFQNFVSLWSETVQENQIFLGQCCELVSKFCIFVVWNSFKYRIVNFVLVVNWFQNFVSLWSETVHLFVTTDKLGCELVSKFCIFVVWNSTYCALKRQCLVVNWFQNFVSLWSETVSWKYSTKITSCELVSKFCIFVVWNSCDSLVSTRSRLWIGFKILYLCGLKQSPPLILQNAISCELVSKFCIFVVWNSTIWVSY